MNQYHSVNTTVSKANGQHHKEQHWSKAKGPHINNSPETQHTEQTHIKDFLLAVMMRHCLYSEPCFCTIFQKQQVQNTSRFQLINDYLLKLYYFPISSKNNQLTNEYQARSNESNTIKYHIAQGAKQTDEKRKFKSKQRGSKKEDEENRTAQAMASDHGSWRRESLSLTIF